MDVCVGGSKWLAERIAVRRQRVLLLTRAGMTQGEVAVLLGVDRKTVNRDLRAVRAHLAAAPPLDVAEVARQAHAQLDEDEAAPRGRLVDAAASEARMIYRQIGVMQERRARWLGFAKAPLKSDAMPRWLTDALDDIEPELPPRPGSPPRLAAAPGAATPAADLAPKGAPAAEAAAAEPADGAGTDAADVPDEVVDDRPGRAGRVLDGGRQSGGGVLGDRGGPGASGRLAVGRAPRVLPPRPRCGGAGVFRLGGRMYAWAVHVYRTITVTIHACHNALMLLKWTSTTRKPSCRCSAAMTFLGLPPGRAVNMPPGRGDRSKALRRGRTCKLCLRERRRSRG